MFYRGVIRRLISLPFSSLNHCVDENIKDNLKHNLNCVIDSGKYIASILSFEKGEGTPDQQCRNLILELFLVR